MSGLRDLCCNRAKIPSRVADALPAFNLILIHGVITEEIKAG